MTTLPSLFKAANALLVEYISITLEARPALVLLDPPKLASPQSATLPSVFNAAYA